MKRRSQASQSERLDYPRLLSIWVKTPILREAEILIASACLPLVDRRVFEKLSEGRTVLLACPEQESSAYYGKIASIVRSSKPRRLIVATVDGSPHCLTLHASVNEAEYILGEKIEREHYVLSGLKLTRISPDAVRVARYLSLVEEAISRNPSIVEKLTELSEEFKMARRIYR